VSISEKALTQISAALNAEWAKGEATWKVYLDKMEAHNARAKHSLRLDKMLGNRKLSSMEGSGT
jgi:hypothetical protein